MAFSVPGGGSRSPERHNRTMQASPTLPVSEVAPYLNEMARLHTDAVTRQQLGGYEELYGREAGAPQVLENLGKSIRSLEQLEMVRLERQERATASLHAMHEYAQNVQKANNWSKDETDAKLANDPGFTKLQESWQAGAKNMAVASQAVTAAFDTCDRAARLWDNVQKMPLAEAQKEVDAYFAGLAAKDRISVSKKDPVGPGGPGSAPDAETFEINGGHEGVINFSVTTDELRSLSDEELESRLLEAGIPGDHLAEVLASLRREAKVTAAPAAAAANGTAPTTPAEAPSLDGERFLHAAESAKQIERDTTKNGAIYADSLCGQNVTANALDALDRLGGVFFDRLNEISDTQSLEQALNDRRDLLIGLTHPLASDKPAPVDANDPVNNLLGLGPKHVSAGLEWLMGQGDPAKLSAYNHELRELARLAKLAEAIRPGGTLLHASGLEEQRADVFGTDKQSLGIFLSEDEMRRFGQSCRETEAFVNEQAQGATDEMRTRLAKTAGTLPLAFSRVAKLLDAAINPSRLTEDQQQKTTNELAFLLGSTRDGHLASNLETNPAGQSVINAVDKLRAIAKTDVEWDKLAKLAKELSHPDNEAHFLRHPMQSSDHANIYLPQEVAGLRALGEGDGDFGKAYSRMTGAERRELWKSVSTRMEGGRSLKAAMGLFLLISNGIYREAREEVAGMIDTDVHQKLHALRGNAVTVEEKLRVRDEEQRQKVGRWRDGVDREFKGKMAQPGEAAKQVLDHLSKGSGLDLNI